jgi:UDP-glucuronate 4-epimerase
MKAPHKIIVTGAAGFIGFHLAKRLLQEGHTVIGIDNVNDYYDTQLKHDRLNILKEESYFEFHQFDLNDEQRLSSIFETEAIDYIVHLAAQAGVRYSLTHPEVYIESNLSAFQKLIHLAKGHSSLKHFIYASSSSVYGANKKIPFSVHDNVDHPVSLYAATKKANELMAHTYSHLFGLPTTGLRFFTVYGPYGRPDMALFLFTKAILEGNPIQVFNHGKMSRDFTYIDDIVESITRLIPLPPSGNPEWTGENPDPANSYAPYQIFNIGNNAPVSLEDFIEIIEKKLDKKANKEYMDLQPGDVEATYADVQSLFKYVNFKPNTSLEEGIGHFIDWYREYYQI